MNSAIVNRLVFFLSFAGLVLALHLWFQKSRGFDQGCLGLFKPQAATVAGGHEVGAMLAIHGLPQAGVGR